MTNPEKKKSYAELIAEEFISNLEKGDSFLQKRWEAGELVAPYNAISGKPYRGVNNMRLIEKKHGDPRWLTFLQASQIGGKVRKGEKGTPILYWVFEERKRARDEETGKPLFDEDGNPIYEVIKLKKPKAIRSIVFNASQIDGIPEYKPEIRDPNLVNSRVEKIIENLGVVVRNNYQDRAFYSPRLDEIHMPNFDQFEDPNAYYATLLHEGVHSTGHETRMNRDFGSQFGDVRYAKEELRAEIASYMLSQRLGVEFDPNHHYAYVNSWIKALKDDPREIIRACSDAEKITEYVLSFDLEREVDNDNLYQVLEPISLDEEQEAFNEKIYLNVPFSEKNEAKNLGAKWDRNKKSWYCPSNLDLKESKLDRWFDREHDEKLNPEKYNTKVDDSPDRVLVDNDYVSYEVIKEKLTWDYDKSKVVSEDNPITNPMLQGLYDTYIDKLRENGLNLIKKDDSSLEIVSDEGIYPMEFGSISIEKSGNNEIFNLRYSEIDTELMRRYMEFGGDGDILSVRKFHREQDHFRLDRSIDTIIESYSSCKDIQLEYQKPTEKVFIDVSESDVAEGLLPTSVMLDEGRNLYFIDQRDDDFFEIISKYKPINVDSALNKDSNDQSLESENTAYKVIKEKLTWDYDKSKVVSEDNPITNPMLQDLYDTYIDKLKENGLNLIKRNDWSLNVVSDQGVYPMEFGSISVKKDNDNNDVLELSYSTRSDESIKKYMELGGANRYILSDHKSYEEQNIAELSGGIDSIIESHSQCKKIQLEYQTPAEKVFIDINKSDIDKDFLYMSVSLDEDRGLYFVDQRNSDFNSIISKYKPIDVDSALNRKGDKLADLDNEKLKATEKIYIDVPYLEKNEAKSLGAKWDRKEKSWYIPEGEEIEKFKKWNEPKIPEREISVEEQFSIALESVGIKSDPHHNYNNDGAIHRLPTHDDKGSKVSGAYALHLNQKIPGGWIKNMKTGEEINWKADVKVASLSEKEIEELKREAEIARKIRERNIKEKQNLTAKISSALWDQSLDIDEHQYAKDKEIKATKFKVVPYIVSEEAEKIGVNVSDSVREIQELKKQGEYAFKSGDMVIPLMNIDGDVRSVQTISSYGDSKSFKSFATGGEKQGMFYQTDGNLPKGDKPIYIAEGIATADAVSQITKTPVVSVFDAGNIKPVVEVLREKFPKTEIIIASDNDHHQKIINGKKLPNVGVEKAREVAKEFNCLVVTPNFDPSDKGTDWNDLLIEKGLEKARSDFSKELSKERDQVDPDFDR